MNARRRLALTPALAVLLAVAGAAGPGVSVAVSNPAAVHQSDRRATGAIGGAILDAATKDPIPGALVSLRHRDGVTGQVTDTKGRFLFTGLADDHGYAVTVTKAGYLDARYPRASPSPGDRDAGIVVAADQVVLGLSVLMSRPGSIAGTVRDDQGNPIVGAHLRVLTDLAVAGRRRLALGPSAETDDRGVYRVAGLRPGRYYVQLLSPQYTQPMARRASSGDGARGRAGTGRAGRRGAPPIAHVAVDPGALAALLLGPHPFPASDPDGRLRVYPVTFHPAAAVIADATAMDLAAGEERGAVDLRVTPAIGSNVAGRFEGAASSLGGLPVKLLLPGTEDLGGETEAAVTVADDGRFMFGNVPSGTYILNAGGTAAEYSTTTPTSVRPALPLPGLSSVGGFAITSAADGAWVAYRPAPTAEHWARQELTTDGRDMTDVVVTLHRLRTLSGRIVWEGRRRNSPSGEIVAQPADGDPALGVLAAVRDSTSPDAFSIPGLRSGRYVLRARPILIAQGVRIRSVQCGGRDVTHTAIEIGPDADLRDCVVTLTDQSIELTGVVRAAGGLATRDATVVVFPSEPDQWRDFGLTPARVASTPVSSNGEYALSTLPAGEYLAIAVPLRLADAWSDPPFLERAAQRAVRVRLNWGERARLDLTMVDVPTERPPR